MTHARAPRLAQLLRAETSLLVGLRPFGLLLALLGLWFAAGVLGQLSGLESALVRLGILVGPLGAVLVTAFALLQWLGNARNARAILALLDEPAKVRSIELATTHRRGGRRHWVVADTTDGARVEVMFVGDADALREELAQAFPKTIAAPSPIVATRLPEAVRHPRELVLVDAARHAIEASIVIVGGGAKRFARALQASTGPAVARVDRSDELDHFVIALAPIRGWAVSLFVYAIDDSFGAVTRVAPDLVASANVTVLAQTSPEGAHLENALLPIAKLAAGRGAVLAFVGSRPALDELTRDGGMTPSIVSHEGEHGARDALRQITSRLLSTMRASA